MGANGQDGSILRSLLRQKGAEILCVSQTRPEQNLDFEGVTSISANLSDAQVCKRVLDSFMPEAIFHVAAVHGSSLNQESLILTSSERMRLTHVEVTRNILNWQAANGGRSSIALSSQMYTATGFPNRINETSAPNPPNYYGETKLQAWELIKRARVDEGIFTSAAILFNHTSSLSKSSFLFPQLVRDILNGISGTRDWLTIKNPLAMIDISSAEEICEGMIASICHTKPDDYVFGSGRAAMISDILLETIQRIDQSSTLEEEFRDILSGYTQLNSPYLVSDTSKARKNLSWSPSQSPSDILFQMFTESLNWGNRD